MIAFILLSFLNLTNCDVIARDDEIVPSIWITPILSWNDRVEDDPNIFNIMIIVEHSRRATQPRITRTENIGCFFADIFYDSSGSSPFTGREHNLRRVNPGLSPKAFFQNGINDLDKSPWNQVPGFLLTCSSLSRLKVFLLLVLLISL